METSEVDTSILSSLHGNRYESFDDSGFLVEGLDNNLPQTLPELSDITDSDTFLHDSDTSRMMTVDSPWNDESASCFPSSTNSNFPLALPGPSDYNEFNGLQNIPTSESPGLGLNSIFASDTDLSDSTSEIGVCGLRNLGNTCFMSAGLQALLSTDSLVTYFIGFDNDESEDSLIGQFSDLVKKYWQGPFSIISPQEFKYVLGKRYAQFRDCSQHDCQEFLALLLDSLHDELVMHIAKHNKVTSRKTRKSSNPKKLLPREIEDFVISSSDYEIKQPCEISPEDVRVNEETKEGNVDDPETNSFMPTIEITDYETDGTKEKVYVNDSLNGKREICCDSSSDSKLIDLKRVKLDDTIMSCNTELVEADSVGSLDIEKGTPQESIINRIFQGQFESTVTCSECNYVSEMREPFMYLSVPLPYATQQQMYVTFVSATDQSPIKYLITVNKQDDIKKVKSELISLIGEEYHPDRIVIAEVFNKHISKILNDEHQVRSIDYNNRDLYAFEVKDIYVELVKDEMVGYVNEDNNIDSMDLDAVALEEGETCTICLECKPYMVQHKDVNNCSCVLCEECIRTSCAHYSEENGKMECPVCRVVIDPSVDLTPIDQPIVNKTIRCLTIPIVIKQANDKGLIGRPALLRLPSVVPTDILYDVVAKLHPYSEDFTLSVVDGQGTMCSRCLWDVHCNGCVIPKKVLFRLHSADTLAITFEDDVNENLLETEMHPGSVEQMRLNKPLTIYDCIDAFCQSELLDDNNPWWCPSCKKNQCATKTLSVSKYPRILIVYLKRFVFHENWGLKLQDSVMFPIDGLVLDTNQRVSYDLYACVSHTGSTSMGHYTSYTKHIESEEWYFFNDETATKAIPGPEDYCNAYILFYKKQGSSDDDANMSDH